MREPIPATVELLEKIMAKKPGVWMDHLDELDGVIKFYREAYIKLLKNEALRPLPDLDDEQVYQIFLQNEGSKLAGSLFRQLINLRPPTTPLREALDFLLKCGGNSTINWDFLSGTHHHYSPDILFGQHPHQRQSYDSGRSSLLVLGIPFLKSALGEAKRLISIRVILTQDQYLDVVEHQKNNPQPIFDEMDFLLVANQEALNQLLINFHQRPADSSLPVVPILQPAPQVPILQPAPKALVTDSLRIQTISMTNILAYASFSVTLEEDTPARLLMVLGDNSTGKSALLRALSLGLANEVDTGTLLRKFKGQWLHRGQPGEIAVTLTQKDGTVYRLTTKITANATGEVFSKTYELQDDEDTWRSLSSDEFPWAQLFVCGYGAARGVGEGHTGDTYSLEEAVGSLFLYSKRLQDPELSLRRLLSKLTEGISGDERERIEKDTLGQVRSWVRGLFLWDDSFNLVLTGRGLEVESSEGRQPLSAHGDGYMNTAAWVLDLIGRSVQARGLDGLRNLSGLVFVDEIEQHLHPRWQREVVQRLIKLFPDLQFVFTTHSPLCALGASVLPNDEAVIIKLERTDGVTRHELMPSFRGMRVDQVLIHEGFGLSSSRDPDTERKQSRLVDLFLISERTADQEAEFKQLEYELDQLPDKNELTFIRAFEGVMSKTQEV